MSRKNTNQSQSDQRWLRINCAGCVLSTARKGRTRDARTPQQRGLCVDRWPTLTAPSPRARRWPLTSTGMRPSPAPSHLATHGGEALMEIKQQQQTSGECSRFPALRLKQHWLRTVRAALPPSPRGCGPANSTQEGCLLSCTSAQSCFAFMVNALPLPSHPQKGISSSFQLKT